MRISLLLILPVLFAACDNSPNEVEEPQLPSITPVMYMPLEVGNSWTNETVFDTEIITLEKDTLINGQTYFKVEGSREFWGYTETGLGNLFLNSDGSMDRKFVYRFPTTSGIDKLYAQPDALTSNRFEWHTVFVSQDSVITTDLGTFSCYVFRSFRAEKDNINNHDLVDELYFAPGIGIIRNKFQTIGINTNDLLSYSVGDSPFDVNSFISN